MAKMAAISVVHSLHVINIDGEWPLPQDGGCLFISGLRSNKIARRAGSSARQLKYQCYGTESVVKY